MRRNTSYDPPRRNDTGGNGGNGGGGMMESVGNGLMAIGLIFFVVVAGSVASDRYFGTKIKSSDFKVGEIK